MRKYIVLPLVRLVRVIIQVLYYCGLVTVWLKSGYALQQDLACDRVDSSAAFDQRSKGGVLREIRPLWLHSLVAECA